MRILFIKLFFFTINKIMCFAMSPKILLNRKQFYLLTLLSSMSIVFYFIILFLLQKYFLFIPSLYWYSFSLPNKSISLISHSMRSLQFSMQYLFLVFIHILFILFKWIFIQRWVLELMLVRNVSHHLSRNFYLWTVLYSNCTLFSM